MYWVKITGYKSTAPNALKECENAIKYKDKYVPIQYEDESCIYWPKKYNIQYIKSMEWIGVDKNWFTYKKYTKNQMKHEINKLIEATDF
jgi:hypothetical protein